MKFLTIVGDAPHALQLVVKDILNMPYFNSASKNCVLVADKFKNTCLRMFLKEAVEVDDGRISTAMPVLTRWGTHINTYKSINKYKGTMCQCV